MGKQTTIWTTCGAVQCDLFLNDHMMQRKMHSSQVPNHAQTGPPWLLCLGSKLEQFSGRWKSHFKEVKAIRHVPLQLSESSWNPKVRILFRIHSHNEYQQWKLLQSCDQVLTAYMITYQRHLFISSQQLDRGVQVNMNEDTGQIV